MTMVLSSSPIEREEVEDAADVVVGVAQEAGEHLHHPARDPLAPRATACPTRARRGRGVTARRRPGAIPSSFWRAKARSPIRVPPVVEGPGVLVGPLRGHVVRGMGRTRAEVEEEGFVRVDLLGVGDELDGPVGQVLGEVVALLGGPRRLDLVVVVDEVGVPLAGVAAQEPVEALEPAPERPAVEGPRTGLLVGTGRGATCPPCRCCSRARRRISERISVLERDDAVVARESGGELGDAGHGVGVVVASRDDARTARRA